MNHHTRETATHPALARRETREQATNEWERILYSPQSGRYAIYRQANSGARVLWGSFATLQEACEARDTLPYRLPHRQEATQQ